MTRKWLPIGASSLAVLLAVAAFASTAARAVELEFHTRVPFWVVDAIPAAVSELYYGHQKRYTALESVHRRFFNRVQREVATARTVNNALRRLEETSGEDPGAEYRLLGPDDKGIVDLVEFSFLLFGLRLESIVTLYFALLLLSSLLFAAAFWRSPSALLLLAAFLAMLYLIMPMVAYNPQLRSVLALRALPILSMVACLHGLAFMATALHQRVTVPQVALVGVQAALIAFTIHLRSTTLWEVATMLGFGAAVLATVPLTRRFTGVTWPPGAGRSALLAAGAAGGLAIAGYIGVKAYQDAVIPEEYRRGDEIATRVIWHNIFTGFAYHPVLRERFQLRLDDVSITAATRDWLVESGRLDEWLAMGGKPPGPGPDAASSFEGVKFAKYDPYVREMTIARCSTYVRECLETALYYKPVSLLNNLAWLYGFRELPPDLEVAESRYFGDILKQQFLGMAQGLEARGWRAYLWTPRALLVIVPFVVLLLGEPGWRLWAAGSASVGLALGSTIPTIVGYASPHTIGETAIAVGMLIYFGAVLIVSAGLRRLLALVRQHQRGRPRTASVSEAGATIRR